jgi:hypothetical protein
VNGWFVLGVIMGLNAPIIAVTLWWVFFLAYVGVVLAFDKLRRVFA